MSLFITIFGGMLLTALLYGAGRMLKLPNFWAAVLAAGLPSLAYLAFAFAIWPGLDVVTMHVVAYPTVSVLLFQLYSRRDGQEETVHWVPKLLIAFFVALTALLGGFVYIAVNGLPPALAARVLPNAQGKILHTAFAGVVEHGDEAAKSIAQRRNIGARLAKLGWNVEVSGLEALGAQRGGEIKVLLRQADGGGVSGRELRLGVARPGQPAPAGEAMREVASGDYRGTLALPGEGAWVAMISIAVEGRRIVLEHAVGWE